MKVLTLKGSVVFQEGEKANTIKKLQCYPSQNLMNVTIVIVVDGKTAKTETNYIQFVPKYIVKPKTVKFEGVLQLEKNSYFSLEITLYDNNKNNVIINNNVFLLKNINTSHTINLYDCDRIPQANKMEIITVKCLLEEIVPKGNYTFERRNGGIIEGIVPLVSGNVTVRSSYIGIKKHINILSLILLFL